MSTAQKISTSSPGLNVEKIRDAFPQSTQTKVHDKPLVYFDNAATTLKPKSVCEAVNQYYQFETANIHRGVHFLSEHNTSLYEKTREAIRQFINAKHEAEVIFTSGTTASINLVALSYGRKFLKAGDEIIISAMEHHSNIVPWQMLCEERGCVLRVIPINDAGELLMDEYEKLLNLKTKIVAVTAVSNTLGTVNPIKAIIEKAHQVNAVVVIDAAQAVAHMPVDVQDLDCDFLAFSGHKLFGPTGTGILYGKKDLLEAMPPLQGGGDMIDQVTFEKTTFNVIPHKFEAGTPHIAGFIGLGPAVEFVQNLGFDAIHAHEQDLLQYATKRLSEIEGLRIIGTAQHKSAVISFVIDGTHPHDIGTLLDQYGIAIRTGHHCTQPLMQRFKVTHTARASFSIYNTREEIDTFVDALIRVRKML